MMESFDSDSRSENACQALGEAPADPPVREQLILPSPAESNQRREIETEEGRGTRVLSWLPSSEQHEATQEEESRC